MLKTNKVASVICLEIFPAVKENVSFLLHKVGEKLFQLKVQFLIEKMLWIGNFQSAKL